MKKITFQEIIDSQDKFVLQHHANKTAKWERAQSLKWEEGRIIDDSKISSVNIGSEFTTVIPSLHLFSELYTEGFPLQKVSID